MGINYNPKKDAIDLYTIKSGDTLSQIAQNNGTTVGKLMSLNPTITDPNRIYSGSVIRLTGEGVTSKDIDGTIEATSGSTGNVDIESDPVADSGATGYKSLWGDTLNDTMQKLLNGEKFSYDFNEDALYQQYKDKYIKQGKLAMADTMGQASAMTGGYGNSYAQSVGNQAYQASLENLNDIVPELYQMAYDRYNSDKQDLYNQYAMLSAQEEQDYSKWIDERNYNYGVERDTIADQQWQTEFDEAKRQYDEQMAFTKQQYEDSKASNIVNNSGGGNNIIVDENGNLKVGNTTTSLPSDVIKKFESFTSDNQVQDYALKLLEGGYDEAEVDKIVAKYLDPNEKYNTDEEGNTTGYSYSQMVESTLGWSVKDDEKGGFNWFGGVDNDAIVTTPTGDKIRLDKLVDILVEEGMNKKDAKAKVKALQKNLKISK